MTPSLVLAATEFGESESLFNIESTIKRTVLVAFTPSNTGINFLLNFPIKICFNSGIVKKESADWGLTITAIASLATVIFEGDTFIESIM